MSRVKFVAPWAVTTREGTIYRALINGVQVTGAFSDLDKRVRDGRIAAQAARANARLDAFNKSGGK